MPALLVLAGAPLPCRRAMQLRGVQAAEASDSDPPASEAQSCVDPEQNGARGSPATAFLPPMSPAARQVGHGGSSPVLDSDVAFNTLQNLKADRCVLSISAC